MNPNRRPLQFATLDAIMPDVEALLASHKTVGHWTLGQICDHLATVHHLLIDAPAEPKPDPSLRLSAEQKDRFFTTGELAEGLPMPGALQTPPTIDAATGVDRLRESLAYYQASPTGPRLDHPFFGPLTQPEWEQVVRIHSAHHLSFAIPQPG